VYLNLRDELGVVYEDEQVAELFCATSGQAAYSPEPLVMVRVTQFMEGLSDRQAAEAMRSRIDWKDGLGWSLRDEGFDGVKQLPPHHQLIDSPYDVDARNRTKHGLNWMDYTVHRSETCDNSDVNLLATNILKVQGGAGDY
jgi:transposase